MPKKRELSKADSELWARLTESVTPHAAMRPAPGLCVPKRPPNIDKPRRYSAKAPPTPQISQMQTTKIAMDAKAWKNLRKGQMKPEASLDLHGKRAAHAVTALREFIVYHHERGRRLLLVITGKGQIEQSDPWWLSHRSRGLLRRELPLWLSVPDMRARVLQITPAHRRHGGDGAYYIYLRLRRRQQ